MVILVIIISLLNISAQKDSLCKSCNVVIIDIDVLRADALPCYGYHRDTAPNICSIAEKGVLFENNYSQNRWTLTSFASTITSLYPSTHNTWVAYKDKISEEIVTMAEVFSQGDYSTYFVGPGYTPVASIDYLPGGFDRGFEYTASLFPENWQAKVEEARTKKKETERPFFIHFHSQDIHLPYLLPEGVDTIEPIEKPFGFPQTRKEYDVLIGEYLFENYQQVFNEQAIKSYPEIFENINSGNKVDLAKFFYTLSPSSGLLKEKWLISTEAYLNRVKDSEMQGVDFIRVMYDTNISLVDEKLKTLLNELVSSGDTIVVIMSQHGEEFNEHGGFAHRKVLYNEIIHTPLIVYIPGITGRKVKTTSQNIDVFPTLMDLVGLKIPKQAQGESIVSYMLGKETVGRFAISELPENVASIQNERWKLIAHDYNNEYPRLELYDLTTDAGEQKNVVDTNPDISKYLVSELKEILEESKNKYDIKQPPFPDWIEEEKRKRLIEEGYF